MTKKVEFKLPAGFTIPEGTMKGDTFDVVVTLQVKDNGEVCLTTLGDSKMPGYDGKDDKSKPDYSEMTQNMQNDMAQQAAPQTAPMPGGGGY